MQHQRVNTYGAEHQRANCCYLNPLLLMGNAMVRHFQNHFEISDFTNAHAIILIGEIVFPMIIGWCKTVSSVYTRKIHSESITAMTEMMLHIAHCANGQRKVGPGRRPVFEFDALYTAWRALSLIGTYCSLVVSGFQPCPHTLLRPLSLGVQPLQPRVYCRVCPQIIPLSLKFNDSIRYIMQYYVIHTRTSLPSN